MSESLVQRYDAARWASIRALLSVLPEDGPHREAIDALLIAADALRGRENATESPGTGSVAEVEAFQRAMRDDGVCRCMGPCQCNAVGPSAPCDAHPEDFCEKCGNINVCWFAPSDVWNATEPSESILCPVCFIVEAEARGFNRASWRVAPETKRDGHDHDPAKCLTCLTGGDPAHGIVAHDMSPEADYRAIAALLRGATPKGWSEVVEKIFAIKHSGGCAAGSWYRCDCDREARMGRAIAAALMAATHGGLWCAISHGHAPYVEGAIAAALEAVTEELAHE